jgi:tartrate-resistant acid phosphatase type 5
VTTVTSGILRPFLTILGLCLALQTVAVTKAPAPKATPPTAETTEPFVPSDSLPLKFAVIGDYGAEATGGGNFQAKVADMVKAWKPEFIITTGDNNYPKGEADTIDRNIGKYYRDYIFHYKGKYFPIDRAEHNRFFPSLGNHDWDCKDCAQNGIPKPYVDYFELPGNERYYKFSWGQADFFAIDSDPRAADIQGGKDSKQAEWLKKELAASDALYRVVYFHHPPFSSGKHGPSKHMQWPFAKWGASIVICGHDHIYERLMVDGIPYLIVGTSGNELYPFESKAPGSVIRDNSGHGSLLVEEEQKSLVFRYFLSDGKFIDSFRVKGKLPEKFKPRKSRVFDLR